MMEAFCAAARPAPSSSPSSQGLQRRGLHAAAIVAGKGSMGHLGHMRPTGLMASWPHGGSTTHGSLLLAQLTPMMLAACRNPAALGLPAWRSAPRASSLCIRPASKLGLIRQPGCRAAAARPQATDRPYRTVQRVQPAACSSLHVATRLWPAGEAVIWLQAKTCKDLIYVRDHKNKTVAK